MNKKLRYGVTLLIVLIASFLIIKSCHSDTTDEDQELKNFYDTKVKLLSFLEAENKRLAYQVRELKNINRNLEYNLKHRQIEIDSLITEIQLIHPTNGSISDKSNELAKKSINAHDLMTTLSQEAVKIENNRVLDSVNIKMQNIQTKNKELVNLVNRLRGTVKRLTNEKKDIQTKYDSVVVALDSIIADKDSIIRVFTDRNSALGKENERLKNDVKNAPSLQNNQLRVTTILKKRLKIFSKTKNPPYASKDIDKFQVSFDFDYIKDSKTEVDTIVLVYNPPPPARVQNPKGNDYFYLKDGKRITYTEAFTFRLIKGKSYSKTLSITNPKGYVKGIHRFQLYSKDGLIGSDDIEVN